VDPVRQTRGFFQWRDGAMVQTGGYYLVAERGDRVALARLVNDLENLPNADPAGGLGGLSPRLEAELIAMLSRPATHAHAPSIDRAQTMTVFTLLGAMLGMIGLAAVLWLNALSGHVAEQGRALDDLRKAVVETAERQRLALDSVVGETAGTSGDDLLRKIARERDEARTKLASQYAINELLGTRTKRQDEDLKELRARYDLARQYEKDAKELADLKAKYGDLSNSYERQSHKVSELEDLLDTPEGKKAMAISQKYHTAWTAAAIGWSVSALLAFCLAGGYAYLRLPPAEATEEPPASGPTHRIS
jgi:hypothetical protein